MPVVRGNVEESNVDYFTLRDRLLSTKPWIVCHPRFSHPSISNNHAGYLRGVALNIQCEFIACFNGEFRIQLTRFFCSTNEVGGDANLLKLFIQASVR